MNKLERTRTSLDFTQERMAKELGLSQPSISRLEKCKRISRGLSLALDGLVAKHRKAKGNGSSGV